MNYLLKSVNFFMLAKNVNSILNYKNSIFIARRWLKKGRSYPAIVQTQDVLQRSKKRVCFLLLIVLSI